ncbi:MAG: Na/Pi cotransporter family protein [Candidatus Competibacteraceae bacterium]|jgi:phosphate:Na+ symporter|nr:Na/Pi cotransporter family protein [Candidatus Competibacteraceae bacterium]
MSLTISELQPLFFGLFGGLALFLYGMRKMTEALKATAGSRLKKLLAALTRNRFTGLAAGTVITALIQSSSITSVLVVGFITAGVLSFSQAIGVIIGANVGTTVTAQIIAFNITQYALLLIALGFLLEVVGRREWMRHYGMVLMGLGFIFFGMELMSEATRPLRDYPPFIDLLQQTRHPLIGVLAGALFTTLVQSSSATTGIVIVLSGQGFISLDAGIALIFGANVGTCATAMLSSIGRPREAVKAAVAHVLFNLGGVLLWVWFIPDFAQFISALSPAYPDLTGTVRLAAETPRQIANAHTFFNIGNALLFIGFTPQLARLVDWLVPARAELDQPVQPKYLDQYFLSDPTVALDQVRLELLHLGQRTLAMVEEGLNAVTRGGRQRLNELRKQDEAIDTLHGEIVTYLSRLSLQNLVEPQPSQIYEYLAVGSYLENIGDVVETNWVTDGFKRLESGVNISQPTLRLLEHLHEQVCRNGKITLEALEHNDPKQAREVLRSKAAFNELAEQARTHLARRLVVAAPSRLDAFRIEMDLIDHFKRIHTLFRRIARVIEVSVSDSRMTSKSG